MGLNISIYRIDQTEGLWELDKVSSEYWDTMRYASDKEFAGNPFLESITEIDHISGQPLESYHRPTDFIALREWIMSNIQEDSRKRYLNILSLMQQDPNLFFYFSY